MYSVKVVNCKVYTLQFTVYTVHYIANIMQVISILLYHIIQKFPVNPKSTLTPCNPPIYNYSIHNTPNLAEIQSLILEKHILYQESHDYTWICCFN